MTNDNTFEEGYAAYWTGVDADDNPHSIETEQHSSWDDGWSQAQLEDDGEEDDE